MNDHGFASTFYFANVSLKIMTIFLVLIQQNGNNSPNNNMVTRAGTIATEITYIGEWDSTQYRRNAPFLMKI